MILTGKSSAKSLTLGRLMVLMAEIDFYLESCYLDGDFLMDRLICFELWPFIIMSQSRFI